MNLLYNLLGVDVVAAEGSTGVLNNIVSESATATTGIVANMTTIGNFLTSNPYLLALLGIAFAAMSGSALIKWIKSISM